MYPLLPYTLDHLQQHYEQIQKSLANLNEPVSKKSLAEIESLVSKISNERLFIYPEKQVKAVFVSLGVLSKKIKSLGDRSLWESLPQATKSTLESAQTAIVHPNTHTRQYFDRIKKLIDQLENHPHVDGSIHLIEGLIDDLSKEYFFHYHQNQLEGLCLALYNLAKLVKLPKYQNLWKALRESTRHLLNDFTEFHYSPAHFDNLYKNLSHQAISLKKCQKSKQRMAVENLVEELSKDNLNLFSHEQQKLLYKAVYLLARQVKVSGASFWNTLSQAARDRLNTLTPFFEAPSEAARIYKKETYAEPTLMKMEDGAFLNVVGGERYDRRIRYQLKNGFILDCPITSGSYRVDFENFAKSLKKYPSLNKKLDQFFPFSEMLAKYRKGDDDQQLLLSHRMLKMIQLYRKKLLETLDLPTEGVVEYSLEGLWEIKKENVGISSPSQFINDLLFWLDQEKRFGIYLFGETQRAGKQLFSFRLGRNYPLERMTVPMFINEDIHERHQQFINAFSRDYPGFSEKLASRRSGSDNVFACLLNHDELLSRLNRQDLKILAWLHSQAEPESSESLLKVAKRILLALPNERRSWKWEIILKRLQNMRQSLIQSSTAFEKVYPQVLEIKDLFELESEKILKEEPLTDDERIKGVLADLDDLIAQTHEKLKVGHYLGEMFDLQQEEKQILTRHLYTQLLLFYQNLGEEDLAKKIQALHTYAVNLVWSIAEGLDQAIEGEAQFNFLVDSPMEMKHADHFYLTFGESFLESFLNQLKRVCNESDKVDVQDQVAFLNMIRTHASQRVRVRKEVACNALLHQILHQAYLELDSAREARHLSGGFETQ